MESPVIYFTVSMWQRVAHFEALLENLRELWEQDPNIELHAVDFCTEGFDDEQIGRYVESVPFPLQIWRINHEFCNGMGHNVAARHVPGGQIVAPIAVDICMPLTICREIREHTREGHSYYAPQVMYQCEDGRLCHCRAAYALFGVFKSDFDRTGGFRQNMMWGGNRKEGGEDIWLMKRLKKLGLREHRSGGRRELYCRWHLRNVEQTFYQSLHRYHTMPYWSKVDAKGEPV